MIDLKLNLEGGRAPTILCLGAHSDDIEIGCGGTILRMIRDYPKCKISWIVFSALGVRKDEAHRAAEAFAGKERLVELKLLDFRDGFMPYRGEEIKQVFENLKRGAKPDLILTHQSQDAHQDHRLLSELTWNTFRDHLILEYEIPKYDGDFGRPNVFIPFDAEIARQKARSLMDCFASQRTKHWFDEETFLGLMRLRGMECNSATRYAEAFYSRKLTI
jgi:LmbE family N-acetylglucosaminyl deacetylase